MAVEINRKLCLTAAWLGADSRKELAAAFHRINPATPFDVQRAHKWLQGRARPRGRQIYEDWAQLVRLDGSADWIAECTAEALLQRLCERHGADRDILLRRAEAFGAASRNHDAHGREIELLGTYACYSHAWSPYYQGRVVRGLFVISSVQAPQRLHGAYSENLPTGELRLSGPIVGGERVVTAQLGSQQAPAQLVLWLFTPTPPMSVLGGFMTGTTLFSTQPQLSVSRLIMVRLPANPAPASVPHAYLAPGESVAADLSTLGLQVESADRVDLAIGAYLTGSCSGHDQVTAADLRDVVELFDRQRLEFGDAAKPGCAAAAVVA